MRVLALNCGSSSFKSAVVEDDEGARSFEWSAEAIEPARAVEELGHRLHALPEHRQPQVVAHRIVHGGERYAEAVQVDDATLAGIESLTRLAPLHQPAALAALRVARALWPALPQVAVFDTAFHSTLPRRSKEYALPRELARSHGLRRYGFHGISHAGVARAVALHLRAPAERLRIVSCHLGSGASVCAIEYGRSIDTSMGMTPLEGLVMGTRAGDLDPGIVLELQRSAGLGLDAVDALLNRGSGLRGLTGTGDLREIERRAAEGDEDCRLALAVYAHRVRKYIGAYAAVLGGIDAIAFTGGIGEHSAQMRHRCLQRLDFLGAVLDEERNRDARLDAAQPCSEISAQESRVRLLAVRADEEAQMAREARALLRRTPAARGPRRIPLAVSARHAHLRQASLDVLFGPGHVLTPRNALSQPGQYASTETVALIGPRGRIDGVRLLGPPREADQVEISRSDEFVLGVDAPVRVSGDLDNTPGITIEGPAGRLQLESGVICARRHIHAHPDEAARLGLRGGSRVAVAIGEGSRRLVFEDVEVRVSPRFSLELHLDTDEGNAAGVGCGDHAELVDEPVAAVTAPAPPPR